MKNYVRLYFEHPSHLLFLQDKAMQSPQLSVGQHPWLGPPWEQHRESGLLYQLPSSCPRAPTRDSPILVSQEELLQGWLSVDLEWALEPSPGAPVEQPWSSVRRCATFTPEPKDWIPSAHGTKLELVPRQKIKAFSVDVRSSAPSCPSDDLFVHTAHQHRSSQNSFHQVC